jgi:hypothetical protein
MEERNPTEEELNTLQEHLTPMEFENLLEELKAFHGIVIGKIISDEPVTDPRGYSLE